MTTGHIFIATSLDGFIARENGDIDWLDSVPAEDHGFERFMASVDGLVMGRRTFEKLLTLVSIESWPFQKPVLVLSATLRQEDVPPALSGQVQVYAGTPEAVIEELERQGWTRAYVDGGQVIQSFLRAGLIKDMIITRIPILLGSGLPLFGPLSADVPLEHVETIAFPSGMVQSMYRVRSSR